MNRTYGHDFLRVQFFSTKFLPTTLSMGDASLLENWILEGDEQGIFPVNAFVFLSIVSIKYSKVLSKKKKSSSSQIKLTGI